MTWGYNIVVDRGVGGGRAEVHFLHFFDNGQTETKNSFELDSMNKYRPMMLRKNSDLHLVVLIFLHIFKQTETDR